MNLTCKLTTALVFLSASVLTHFSVSAEEKLLDRVAVVVNQSVVLESEIADLVNNVKKQAITSGQSLPSDSALRAQAVDKLITDSLLMQLGERMGIQVSDAQLDDTLTNMARENNLSLDEFRAQIEREGLEYDKYRESVRKELISGEVRRSNVRRRVYMTPQEVENLVKVMQEQTSDQVDYRLGHILIEFPTDPTQADVVAAKERADKVVELLNNGSDFKKIAIASSGAANALEGGDLGWNNINEMPTLFSEVVAGKNKGEIFGPLRTGLGFSIIKILDIRGKQTVEVTEVDSRHILIAPTIILSEAKAEQMLLDFLEQIKAGEADFAELAKEYSEDKGSAARGGELGWTDPESFVPAFKQALSQLEEGEYHKPFRSSFGWHLLQLKGRRTLDATDKMTYNRASQLIFNRRFAMESARWLKEIRDEAYIEVK